MKRKPPIEELVHIDRSVEAMLGVSADAIRQMSLKEFFDTCWARGFVPYVERTAKADPGGLAIEAKADEENPAAAV